MGTRREHTVRVIAGEFRGRRLFYPDRRILRPTMDRTREALFSSIQARLRGGGFADLFCAAGGVGIEALSRGAAHVDFVERDPDAIDYLRRNLEGCGVPLEQYRIYAGDVFDYIAAGALKNPALKVVFADPPYDARSGARVLDHLRLTAYDNLELFVLEHRYPVDTGPLGGLVYSRTKKFGDSLLSYWERND